MPNDELHRLRQDMDAVLERLHGNGRVGLITEMELLKQDAAHRTALLTSINQRVEDNDKHLQKATKENRYLAGAIAGVIGTIQLLLHLTK